MPIVDATKPALTAKRACSCGEDRGLRRRAAPAAVLGRPRDAGPAAVEQLALPGPARVEVLAVGRSRRRAGPASRARAPRATPRASDRNSSSGHRPHPNRVLDTCKVPCQDRRVFHDPATFAHGFPHDTFRALRADDPVSHHDHPDVEAGLLGRRPPRRRAARVARLGDVPQRAAPVPRRRDARGRRRRCRSCSSARTRRSTPSCAS